MLLCKFTVVGISDLMFGMYVSERKKDDETHDQHERRTWRKKVAVATDGQCFLQPFALKNGLESASQWLSLKIPGESRKTFTKRFIAGILVVDKLLLYKADGSRITLDDVEGRELFVPSDGKRGGSKRVIKIFPTITEWRADAVVHVFDNKITGDVMERHLDAFGKFIGFGSMRVQNGGINGRCAIEEFAAEEVEVV
ncbi:hypothetical protein LCGC14_1149490 [marine sediment metagenome]|uniref:Uncharacterized protein n=1 Tax=marine sediment metagenome TaxID=412755 RepID=A0A0F9LW03_9ZZZZ